MSESENAKKLFFEALALIDSSNFEHAELRFRDALKLAPDNAAILKNLSIVLLRRNKHIDARECAEKAVAINPDDIDALLVLADCYGRNDDLNEALATYDKIASLDPKIAEAHNNRGNILERLGRHTDALHSYDRALALNSSFSDAHSNRGNALNHLRRHDEALAAYDKALVLVPDLAEAWLGRGNALSELKRDDEALAAYDKSLALKPNSTHAWIGRGNVFCKLRRYDEGLDAYAKALTENPDLAEAWLGRGNVLCDLKRYDEALAAHDRALALRPDLAAAWLGRGNVFHELKRYGEALAAYDKALALNPDFASAWLGRGNALRVLKRAQDSVDAYRQALKLGCDAESTKYYLAALGAEPLPAASPERFVTDLFDSYADSFEKDLVENLKYQTPALLANAIKRYAASNTLDILDMGCGTGLMGERVRPLARTLTGVDLSAKMLQRARQRQIYDRLLCCDLTQFLQTQDQKFDLAVAADVFVYLGDLSLVFGAVRRALRDGGLFCFSVEATDEGDFVLRSTLRYAHSIGYLRKLAEQYQFVVETVESQIIRQDAGANISGYLTVMRCSEPSAAVRSSGLL